MTQQQQVGRVSDQKGKTEQVKESNLAKTLERLREEKSILKKYLMAAVTSSAMLSMALGIHMYLLNSALKTAEKSHKNTLYYKSAFDRTLKAAELSQKNTLRSMDQTKYVIRKFKSFAAKSKKKTQDIVRTCNNSIGEACKAIGKCYKEYSASIKHHNTELEKAEKDISLVQGEFNKLLKMHKSQGKNLASHWARVTLMVSKLVADSYGVNYTKAISQCKKPTVKDRILDSHAILGRIRMKSHEIKSEADRMLMQKIYKLQKIALEYQRIIAGYSKKQIYGPQKPRKCVTITR